MKPQPTKPSASMPSASKPSASKPSASKPSANGIGFRPDRGPALCLAGGDGSWSVVAAASRAGIRDGRARGRRVCGPAAFSAPLDEHREWLESVSGFISRAEREFFLAIQQDYRRDAFIDKFWEVRDPDPMTRLNELYVRWKEYVAEAAIYFGFNDARAVVYISMVSLGASDSPMDAMWGAVTRERRSSRSGFTAPVSGPRSASL